MNVLFRHEWYWQNWILCCGEWLKIFLLSVITFDGLSTTHSLPHTLVISRNLHFWWLLKMATLSVSPFYCRTEAMYYREIQRTETPSCLPFKIITSMPQTPQSFMLMHVYIHTRHPCNAPSKNPGYRSGTESITVSNSLQRNTFKVGIALLTAMSLSSQQCGSVC